MYATATAITQLFILCLSMFVAQAFEGYHGSA